MAKAKEEVKEKRERKWSIPNRRAKGFADERKNKVHMHGDKEGQELTDYEAGLRSGYLMCQSDHAGHFKYRQAREAGKSKEEAAAIAKIIGKGK